MKRVSKKNLALLLTSFFLLLSPGFLLAQATVNPSPDTGITYECPPEIVNGVSVYGNCKFEDLIKAVQYITNKLVLFTLSFSVVVIAYAGYRYMISGDNPGERTKANEMLKKVAIGIFFILAAWLIVTLITNALVNKNLIPSFFTN